MGGCARVVAIAVLVCGWAGSAAAEMFLDFRVQGAYTDRNTVKSSSPGLTVSGDWTATPSSRRLPGSP